MQIDIGFGDVVTPAAVQVEYPTLLNLPAPVLAAYPRETVVAEKCEAMVKLGMANSRMKDFHDLRSLAEQSRFEGAILARSIAETFARRRTDIPAVPPTALTAEFYEDNSKRQQWSAFTDRNRLYIIRRELPEVVTEVAAFLMPGGPWAARRDSD